MTIVAACLLGKIGQLSLEFKTIIQKPLDIPQEIDCWNDNLEDLRTYAREAEKKQSNDKFVLKWLKDVDYLILDLEDVITDLEHEYMRREASSNMFTKFCKAHSFTAFKFGYQMINRFETYKARLKKMIETSRPPLELGSASQVSDLPNYGALKVEPILFGREEEKRWIMDELLSYNDGDPEIGVLAIVGMGGIGKTAIALDVYNDQRVKNFFEVRSWFSVSRYFNMFCIMEGLLDCIAGTPRNVSAIGVQNQLMKELKGKKFLIILDDMWNDKEGDWECLMAAFKGGSAGSKVIVTTRSEHVANMARTVKKYPKLQPVLFEDCWKLFCSKVGVSPIRKLDARKEEVGKQIVRRCNGVPLAAEIYGCLLRNEKRLQCWENVRDKKSLRSNHRDAELMSVMMLSYIDLPEKLKRCFALLSVFPEDHEFSTYDMARLWCAENLIQEWEVTATERYNDVAEELVARSLLTTRNHYGYVMHDKVRELACEVAGKKCCMVDDNSIERIGDIFKKQRTRHLHFRGSVSNYEKLIEHIKSSSVLRSLSLIIQPTEEGSEIFLVENKVCSNNYFSKLKYLIVLDCEGMSLLQCTHLKNLTKLRHLRIVNSPISNLPDLSISLECLTLQSCKNLDYLPSNIGNLQKLRSLELKQCGILNLSNSITLLKNLENLDLSKCEKLMYLPSNIGNLMKLKALYLCNCKFSKLPDSLTNLCKLKHLDLSNCPIDALPSNLESIQDLKIIVTS